MPFLLIALPLFALLLWLSNGVRQIGQVSKGSKIHRRKNTALLLVDLQTVFWQDGPYSETDKARAEQAITLQIAASRENGEPIIVLRQEWSLPVTKFIAKLAMKGQAIAGTPGTELAPPFFGRADYEIVKRVQDGFETGELDELLSQLNIGTLKVAGLDGIYCVAKTAEAALNRGYSVSLVTDGILTTEQEKMAAEYSRLTSKGATQA
ncbi:MAG: cysteine hydrolase family protein [Cognatishimia sp.]